MVFNIPTVQISQEKFRETKGQLCVSVSCGAHNMAGGEYYRKFPNKNPVYLMALISCETCGLEILVSHSGTPNMVYQIIGYRGYA